jgi:uncharacterized membrane protein
MFEFLFKYPTTVFAKGGLVLLSGWPPWVLAAAILAAATVLGWQIRRNRALGARRVAVWLLETAFIALVLLLLWRPAISIASLKPQENIVAVLVDDSRSMAIREDGKTRIEQALATLNGGLVSDLKKKFQVRVYRFGADLERVDGTDSLAADQPASHLAASLREIAAEASSLPIGAAVVLSDGAENSGGIGLDTISQLRRRRLPVHTIGYGREHASRDVEIEDAVLPARALADSNLVAAVTLRQYGYDGQKVRLVARDSGKTLASQEVTLKGAGADQTESVMIQAGAAGARNIEITVETLPGEENVRNNTLTRVVNVSAQKPRILYIEGEPRWEMKFIRRALEDDAALQLVSMVRTTENKIYRQGIQSPTELEQGFPSKAEDLFAFDGLIFGSIDANYFTPGQQELIRDFVDRRGGGALFLGGRAALSEGGYTRPPFSDLLPVSLPNRKGTFHRDSVALELTPIGRESVILRLAENPEANIARWKKMPVLADYQEAGEAKPGAVTLAERGGRPLLITENYGRGRTAVFATGGSWRWRMLQDHTDRTHEIFWRQFLRWLVAGTPGPVLSSTPNPVLSDEGSITLAAEVRDKSFRSVPDAHVEARILGPGGASATVELTPKPQEQGAYSAEWNAEAGGSYLAEVVATRDGQELGRDIVTFRREDGAAENFHTGQNRELLTRLSAETGGSYYTPNDTAKLANEVQYSEAGITVRETRDLWDMPAVFLLALMLRAAEWLLRRKWGAV